MIDSPSYVDVCSKHIHPSHLLGIFVYITFTSQGIFWAHCTASSPSKSVYWLSRNSNWVFATSNWDFASSDWRVFQNFLWIFFSFKLKNRNFSNVVFFNCNVEFLRFLIELSHFQFLPFLLNKALLYCPWKTLNNFFEDKWLVGKKLINLVWKHE